MICQPDTKWLIAQSAGAVEYTDSFSAEGSDSPPTSVLVYDTKQSDGELCGMQSTPSLSSLPGPLWPGVVAPNKGPIYGLNRIKLHTNAKLDYLKNVVNSIGFQTFCTGI